MGRERKKSGKGTLTARSRPVVPRHAQGVCHDAGSLVSPHPRNRLILYI